MNDLDSHLIFAQTFAYSFIQYNNDGWNNNEIIQCSTKAFDKPHVDILGQAPCISSQLASVGKT